LSQYRQVSRLSKLQKKGAVPKPQRRLIGSTRAIGGTIIELNLNSPQVGVTGISRILDAARPSAADAS
jgi:hypothetical protein